VVGSIAGSWLIGLAYLLSLLFAVQDIASVQATKFAIPIAQLFYDAVGPRLTQVCLLVVMVSQVMAAITTYTASSRLFYALARDNAFPLKKQFTTLNRFQAPYWGVWTSVLIACLLSCAYIASAIAVGFVSCSRYSDPDSICTFYSLTP
jgi:amino acid transporter